MTNSTIFFITPPFGVYLRLPTNPLFDAIYRDSILGKKKGLSSEYGQPDAGHTHPGLNTPVSTSQNFPGS